jgi:hypothetical protein
MPLTIIVEFKLKNRAHLDFNKLMVRLELNDSTRKNTPANPSTKSL